MSRIRDTIFAIIAATTLIATLGALPALADEVAAVAREAVAKEVVAAANDTRGAIPAPEALVAAPVLVAPPLAPAKPKSVRAVQAPLVVRSTAGPQYHWDCFGFWCGRQFVLMLGVGY
jgi:hypothetical protein